MAMERPAWTVCLMILWILILPALIFTHVSVGKLAPAVGDLPSNLAKGFDIVFGFASLQADSMSIQTAANAALAKCGRAPAPGGCASSTDQNTQDVTAEKDTIAAAFQNSLNTIGRVTNDKYLGTDSFQSTNTNIQTMLNEQAKLSPTMPCAAIVSVYCQMHSSATAIINGIGQVNAQIATFKSSDIIKSWEDNKQFLSFLHALPYFLIIGMLFFTFFWYQGGVCCCCRKGTKSGCFALPCFALFWLTAFVIWAIIGGLGTVLRMTSDKIEVPVLKGKPNLHEVTKHFEQNFPKFWDTVFKGLYEGCEMILPCAWLFFFVIVCIFFYSCCLCCCTPYRGPDEDAVAPASKVEVEPVTAQAVVDPVVVGGSSADNKNNEIPSNEVP